MFFSCLILPNVFFRFLPNVFFTFWTDTPEKRTENNLIVRSGISEAETTVLIIQEAQLSQRGRAMLRVCL